MARVLKADEKMDFCTASVMAGYRAGHGVAGSWIFVPPGVHIGPRKGGSSVNRVALCGWRGLRYPRRRAASPEGNRDVTPRRDVTPILSFIIAVGPVSVDMYLPAFGQIAREFQDQSAPQLSRLFVTEQLAATLASAASDRYLCEYAGIQPMAKEVW
jgi:hypothetical protein